MKKARDFNYPYKSLKRAIDELKKLPGVGPRLAERMVDYMIEEGPSYLETFYNVFKELADNIKQCKECFGYAESELCSICCSSNRNRELLCIVEYPRNILKIENINEYKGLYFVVGNIDSQNINNNDRIRILQERLSRDNIKEVILALGTDYNSAFTATYITEKMLIPKKITVSQLSIGVPFGYPIEFVDTNTLSWAFKLRKYLR